MDDSPLNTSRKIFKYLITVMWGFLVFYYVYYHIQDAPNFDQIIFIFIISVLVYCLLNYIKLLDRSESLLGDYIKLLDRSESLLEDYIKLFQDSKSLRKKTGSLLEDYIKLFQDSKSLRKRTESLLQEAREDRRNFFSIYLNKDKSSSSLVNLKQTSLFISENKSVIAFNNRFDKEVETAYDSLNQIEKRIKDSDWNEGKFLYVSDDILINFDFIKKWELWEKNHIRLSLKGAKAYGKKTIFKTPKRIKSGLQVQHGDGIILPRTKNEKYKENQNYIKKHIPQKSA